MDNDYKIIVPQDLYEDAARLLDEHDDYKVIRRLKPQEMLASYVPGLKTGIFLDTEATGTDIVKDDITELGMVMFAYDDEGRIHGTLRTFDEFRQPSIPIPYEVTALTGISNSLVDGKTISEAEVNEFVAAADIIIAHHAAYDRPMVEKIWPIFKEKYWACSFSEIDWREHGFDGAKLGLLLMQMGYFHNGHRALDDCHAGVRLLANEFPNGRTGLSILLESAKRTRYRIDAHNTPYEANTLLKDNGYKFDRDIKGWTKSVVPELVDAEVDFIQKEVYRDCNRMPVTTRLTAKDRFSKRL